jgi:predicted transcriptional regulator
MSDDRNVEQNERWRDEIPIWTGYSLIAILTVWLILEAAGKVNWVRIQPPLGASDFGPIASAVGTIVLTFGLLLLYDKQARLQGIQAQTQRNQERLMEQQFQPFLTGEVGFMNVTSVNFAIQNSGNGPAFDVSAEWSVAGQSRSWEIPRLPAGEKHSFPIVVDGDDWLLTSGEIKEFLNDHNAGTEIQYSIECKDRFDEPLEFSGTVDFGVLIQRSNSDEIWETDPLEEMQNDLSKIQRDIRKMRRSQKKDKRSSRWQNRINQTNEIEALVEKHGELTVDQIKSLTNISETNIRYRLRALDSAGSIHFLKNSDKAKSGREGQNKELSDF